MAKGSPLMGTQRGKLGEAVLYRKQGEQVARAYIRHISNPRSQRQQIQRMITATAISAYSGLRAICDHSYEGVRVGMQSMNYFLSANAKLLRSSIIADREGIVEDAKMSFSRRGNSTLVLNPYIVARGSLPSIPYFDFTDASQFAQVRGYTFVPCVGTLQPAELAQYPSIWLAENGVQDDTYLTLVMIVRYNGDIVGDQQLYRMHWARWYCYDTEGDLGHANVVKFSASSLHALRATDTQIPFSAITTTDNGKWWGVDLGDFLVEDEQDIVAFCWIQSKWRNGKPWLRSNAQLYIRRFVPNLELDWPTDFQSSLETYQGVVSPVGDAAYILNGGAE